MIKVMRVVAVLSILALPACINTSTVLDAAPDEDIDADALAARAWSSFERLPRNEAAVRAAFDAMRTAARATEPTDPVRFDRLVAAARYGIWLARHASDTAARSAAAEQTITLCNTAVQAEPDRVEGYYLRAVAVGLFARHNELYGVDAMAQIRSDARRAIELDETFDGAGPHRVLGALYLRAPGPPAGVGSLRRALHHLEAACRLAPDRAENLLFLAEALLEAGRTVERVPGLLAAAEAAVAEVVDDRERATLTEWLSTLRERLGQG